jgi:hypothetical protein
MAQSSEPYRRRDIAAVLGILLVLAFVGREVLGGGLDRNRACADHAYRLIDALKAYTQDYDETFPPKVENTPQFEQILMPYVGPDTHYVLRCPATRNTPYILNAALSGKPTAVFGDIETTEVLRDAKPHPDGKLTIGYLDGAVERGGVNQADPKVECPTRASKLVTALHTYSDDYDENFPIFHSDQEAEDLLYPYIRTHRTFDCPATLLPFRFNPDLSGRSLGSIPDLAVVEAVRDPKPHKDGKETVAYLDGYVERGGLPVNGVEQEAVIRAENLASGVLAYANDHDNALPPMNDYAAFQAAVFPYVPVTYNIRGGFGHYSSRAFTYPETNLGFVLNATLHGQNITDVPNPAQTVLLHGPVVDKDGKMVFAYVDGHVLRLTP